MIRKTIIALLTLGAVGTGALWIASYTGGVNLVTKGFDVAFQRLINSMIAGDRLSPAMAEWYPILFQSQNRPVMEFQTPGWEDRLASPATGVALLSKNGMVVFDYLDYRPPSGWTPQAASAAQHRGFARGRFIFTVDYAAYVCRLTIQSLIWPVCLLLAIYPTLAFIRGPLRRYRRRKRGLCEKCGYDLTGLMEPRCPECGEAV